MLTDERRNESLTFVAAICKKQKSQKLFAAPEDICAHHISQDFVCCNVPLCFFKPEGDPNIIALLNLPDIDDNLRWRNYSQVGFCCGATNAFLNSGAVASHL